MSDRIATIKVKPWGKDQGEFVEINAADFDPAVHKHCCDPVEPPKVDPLDHDANGKKGGSLPKPAPAKSHPKKGAK